MKNRIRLVLGIALFSNMTFAQVAIGKAAVTNKYVSLEFGNVAGNPDLQKGLLLPWVTSSSSLQNVDPGTLIFDTSDKKVKFLVGGSSPKWFDLTLGSNGQVDTILQDNLNSDASAKVSIGANTSDVPGILVLEDPEKALILPLIDNYKTIENPSAGMIAYDTTNNLLCVFNGTQWTFWKENAPIDSQLPPE